MSKVLESILTVFPERPRTAVLMSGQGSNAAALLASEQVRDQYDMRLVFSDKSTSNAAAIAERFGVPHEVMHVGRFGSDEERSAYFGHMLKLFGSYGIQAAAYAGFLKVASTEFCEAVPGVNVHPANLTILGEDGLAQYRGMHALGNMRRDLGYVASSFHAVDNPVDTGSVFAISSNVACSPELSDRECHGLLKAHEHTLYPQGLDMLASGVAMDELPVRIAT